MDQNLGGPTGIQLRARRPGIGTGSHNEYSSTIQVHPFCDEVKPDRNNGATLSSQRSLTSDMPRRLESLLNDVTNGVGDGLLTARLTEGTLHLSSDFALPENHRLHTSSHPEQTPHSVVLTEELGGFSQHICTVICNTLTQCSLAEPLGDRVSGGFNDQAHPVARRQHKCAPDLGMIGQCQAEPVNLRGSLGNDIKPLIGMIYGQDTQSHKALFNQGVTTNPSTYEAHAPPTNRPTNGIRTQ